MRRACAGLLGLSVMAGLLSLSACRKKEPWEFGDGIPTKVEEAQKQEPIPIDHFVKISTTKGDMWAELFPDMAPKTVENFLKLIDMKYYDGLTFHRIVRDFMIQGGDDKKGGPGWTIKRELSAVKHCRGTLSMARTQDPDSANAQFFIVHKYSDSSKALTTSTRPLAVSSRASRSSTTSWQRRTASRAPRSSRRQTSARRSTPSPA